VIKDSDPNRAQPGLEWWLLRRLPRIAQLGLAMFAAAWFMLPHLPWQGDPQRVDASVAQAGYALIGGLIFFFTMLLTVFIGCAIVFVMKGPAYTSTDSFWLEDADKPQ